MALGSLVTAPDAMAQAFADCAGGREGASIKCPYGQNATAVTGPPAAPRASTAPSDVRWDPYSVLGTQADGRPCWGTETRPVPADSPPNAGATAIRPSESGEVYDLCPPATRSAQASAAAIAVRAWEDVPLPAPKPRIAPGRAITGKWAYLETRNQTRFEFRKDTLVGTLEIRATGTYKVDWGDGEASGPHSVEGKSWPDGEIRHDYISVGSYDVVVTERWTATWQLGPWSGTLRDLQTVGRIDDFPVQEIQAVVRS